MKVFNRRNVLKGGLVGSMAAGFASFVGASHAAEPAAKAPAQNDKNTYDVIVLGAGPAGLVTAIAAKQLVQRSSCIRKTRPSRRERYFCFGLRLRLGLSSSERAGYQRYCRRFLRHDDGRFQTDGR